jgi:hypothetical protein
MSGKVLQVRCMPIVLERLETNDAATRICMNAIRSPFCIQLSFSALSSAVGFPKRTATKQKIVMSQKHECRRVDIGRS